MNKQTMVEAYRAFLREYRLSPADVTLVAGSACVMYGIRESTTDIDVQVTPVVYAQLKEYGEVIESTLEGCGTGNRLVIGDFDIMVSTYASTVVEGVGVMTLTALKGMKEVLLQRLQRDKDRKDLFVIEQLLGQ